MKMLIGIVAIVSLAMLAASVLASETTIPTVADIEPATCGIGSTGTGLDFGTLAPGATSDEETTTIDLTGTSYNLIDYITLNIYGADWTYDTGTVGDTSWSKTSVTGYTALTTSPAEVGTGLDPLDSIPLYFKLTVSPTTTFGSASQTITVQVTC